MPRPCAVETHAHGYKITSGEFADATALRRGDSRSWLQNNVRRVCRCHGLAPWSLTLTATRKSEGFADATARGRGISGELCSFSVAASVRHRGARPWNLRRVDQILCCISRREMKVSSGTYVDI